MRQMQQTFISTRFSTTLKPASLLLAGVLLTGLVGCGITSDGSSTSTGQESPPADATSDSDTSSGTKPTEPPADAPVTPTNIEGSYQVTGTNPDGSAYEGTLLVTQQGEVYQFSWNAGNTFEGVGILDGNYVVVGYDEVGDGCAVSSYQMTNDGLDGLWGVYNETGIGTEKATREGASGADLSGSYSVTGTNPDDTTYGGTLSMAVQGPLYQMTWSVGAPFEGIGFEHGDILAVTYGSETCAVVSYEIQQDGTLDGIWGYSGIEQLGTEVATPQ
jgi:hypothetical protein